MLLSAEKGLKGKDIADIVRESHLTILRWLKRYNAEGIDGLYDTSRPGRSVVVTNEYRKLLLETVRRRPRSLELEYSMWTQRGLTDYLAEKTGLRFSHETVHRHLAKKNLHPKIVQQRLGHSTISLTLDTYSHVAPGMQQASDEMEHFFKVGEQVQQLHRNHHFYRKERN